MKHVFIVGCPRSGTSWLQLLMAQHPQVATTQETHLFDGYLRYLDQAWKRYARWNTGINRLYCETEFHALCARFANDVFQRIAATNPAATVILEKTPAHVRYGELILKLVPDACFIHLVRDPRSVVASLCAAGKSWGSEWASDSVVDNAQLWRSDVATGRALAALTKSYREVRYEDINGISGAAALASLYGWTGLSADTEFCRKALDACRIDRLRGGSAGLRASEALLRSANFYRKGTVDGWRQDLSPRDVRVIEYIGGDLMEICGYTRDFDASSARRKPLAIAISELADGIEWRLRKGIELAFDRFRATAWRRTV